MKLTTCDVYKDGQIADSTMTMMLDGVTHAHAWRTVPNQVYLQLMDDHCDEAVAFMSVEKATSLRDQLTAAIEEATK